MRKTKLVCRFQMISSNILNIFKTFNKNKYKNTYNDEADDPYIAQVLIPSKEHLPILSVMNFLRCWLLLDLDNLVLGKLYLEKGMMA